MIKTDQNDGKEKKDPNYNNQSINQSLLKVGDFTKRSR